MTFALANTRSKHMNRYHKSPVEVTLEGKLYIIFIVAFNLDILEGHVYTVYRQDKFLLCPLCNKKAIQKTDDFITHMKKCNLLYSIEENISAETDTEEMEIQNDINLLSKYLFIYLKYYFLIHV